MTIRRFAKLKLRLLVFLLFFLFLGRKNLIFGFHPTDTCLDDGSFSQLCIFHPSKVGEHSIKQIQYLIPLGDNHYQPKRGSHSLAIQQGGTGCPRVVSEPNLRPSPNILPPDSWTQSEEYFKAVNGNLFTTSLVTKKPIGIRFSLIVSFGPKSLVQLFLIKIFCQDLTFFTRSNTFKSFLMEFESSLCSNHSQMS